MKKRLNQKDRFKFFIVNALKIKRIKVYKRGFTTRHEAEYAIGSVFPDKKGLVIMRGYEILIRKKGSYTLIPYKGRLLKPSEYLFGNPNVERRVRRGRRALAKDPRLRSLFGRKHSRSSVINTLAREMLIT